MPSGQSASLLWRGGSLLVVLVALYTYIRIPSTSIPTPNLSDISTATVYTLPPLPYAYDALEPQISNQIMELHHSKHHQTYVTNLNKAIKDGGTNKSLMKFNGGGHINHSLFWKNLAPAGSAETSGVAGSKLKAVIKHKWGSQEAFETAFSAALLGIQGSGWGWLVKKANGELEIVTTKDQDPITGATPIVGVDMWEHAYYLQYLNGKAAYVENIWKIINWKVAEERFLSESQDEFKELKAMF
ncbi:Superoxide dismutase [Mn], mitochondrial [Cryomyces minteri]|uniref:Superoxide dismutase n=1 Tax=Cryomyces minteri TaxID=331657 RepID=A0A4U0WPG6_9PEZI|nr:Superoxide dismutase [Mn], mitochondrial [Cryomyces minteri]